MKKLLIVIPVIALAFACNKSSDNNNNTNTGNENGTLSGRYMGTFYRTTSRDTANVSLVFDGNMFSGSTDKPKYPAICNGTFTLASSGGQIRFDDACNWTADFDWSLILDGDYEFYINQDKSVSIVRHGFASSDFYTLWKVVR